MAVPWGAWRSGTTCAPSGGWISCGVGAGVTGRGEGMWQVVRCDLCDSAMWVIHCKLRCQRCGYTRDCSDP